MVGKFVPDVSFSLGQVDLVAPVDGRGDVVGEVVEGFTEKCFDRCYGVKPQKPFFGIVQQFVSFFCWGQHGEAERNAVNEEQMLGDWHWSRPP